MNTFNEILAELQHFSITRDLKILKSLSYKIIDEIKKDDNDPKIYFCLSFVFYLLDNNIESIKYFKIGERLSYEIPQELIKLRNEIINENSRFKTFDFDDTNKVSFESQLKKLAEQRNRNYSSTIDIKRPEPVKPVINKESNFWKNLGKV